MTEIESQIECTWSGKIISDPFSKAYHDKRWCKELHEDKELFAMLLLEGMQAGLSWSYILKKEEAIRRICDSLDPDILANYTETDFKRILEAKDMLHNKAKIRALKTNAIAYHKVKLEFGSFDKYVWSFTNHQRIDHKITKESQIPVKNEVSIAMSKDMKKRGFVFCGPKILYSYLQGIGVYNDHLITCSCHGE